MPDEAGAGAAGAGAAGAGAEGDEAGAEAGEARAEAGAGAAGAGGGADEAGAGGAGAAGRSWDTCTTPDAADDDYRDLSGDAITTRESIHMNQYRDAGAPEIRAQCNLATARNLFRKWRGVTD